MQSSRPLLPLSLLLLLTLALAACGAAPAAAPAQQAPPTVAAAETRLTLAVLQPYAERFQQQAKQYTAKTDIQVEVIPLSHDVYSQTLSAMFDAGIGPDAYMATPYLPPPPERAADLNAYYSPAEIAEFLPGATAAFAVDGALLALPVETPAACEPFFRALALNPGANDRDNAAGLIRFLADAPQQEAAFKDSDGQILPTLTTLYQELTVCPPALKPVPPLPGQSEEAKATVEARKGNLREPLAQYEEVLKSYDIPFESADLVSSLAVAAEAPAEEVKGVTQTRPPGLAAALPWTQVDEAAVMVAALAPINVNVTDEEAEKLLASETGLVLGAAFGVLPSDPPFHIENFDLQPDVDVLVTARVQPSDADMLDLFVVFPDVSEEFIGSTPRLRLQNQMPVPLVVIGEEPMLSAQPGAPRLAVAIPVSLFRHRNCAIDWSIDKHRIRAFC